MATIKITITTSKPMDVEVTERILSSESEGERLVQIQKELTEDDG